MNILTGKSILIISPEPWNHDSVSKHHYAVSLTKAGNRVYFLNPPSSINSLSKCKFDNLFIIDYKQKIRGLNKLPAFLSSQLMRIEVRKVMKLIRDRIDIVWTFDPFRFQYLNLFNSRMNFYYAADLHYNIKNYEQITANHADIVLSPSSAILESIKTVSPKYLIQHAVADYFFREAKSIAMPGKNPLKVLYVGNLGSKYLDEQLALEAIRLNSNLDFIFIGNESQLKTEIKAESNVYCVGRKENEDIPDWLKTADILWLYYDTEKYRIAASNSHKIMEYLSSGKPIVSTRISEYIGNDLLIMPDANKDIPELIKHVSQNIGTFNSEVLTGKRIEYAKAHTYKEQLKRIDRLLSSI